MEIKENQLVVLEYELYVKNSDGTFELMEATNEGEPLKYIHGVGLMMPKFEEMLLGKQKGDAFDFSISHQDAYGEHLEENIVGLSIDMFAPDGKLDKDRFFVGAIVPLVNNDGQRINAEITDISDTEVTVDLNHPLAGEDLYFKGTVLDVYTPTEKDIQEFTSMSGGCNCGSSDDCGSGGCGTGGCGCGC